MADEGEILFVRVLRGEKRISLETIWATKGGQVL